MDLVDAPNARPHFFGSTVTAPARSVPQGVGKWLLIDGQQRLSKTQLFLAVLRDAATHVDAQSLSQKIEGQSLLTAYEVGDEQFKVFPTPWGTITATHRLVTTARTRVVVLGLDDDGSLAIPTTSPVGLGHEQPLLLAGRFVVPGGLLLQLVAGRFEPGIQADSERVPHAEPLADGIHRGHAEPAFGPDFDVDIRPALADFRDHDLQILNGSQRGVGRSVS